MEVCTIGFTKRTAADFFGTLSARGIRRLVDVRLNNSSQLAGFSKREDLRFFLHELCGAEYIHEPLLAPTPELFAAYRKRRGTWEAHEDGFFRLMAERRVETRLNRGLFETAAVLLCSEPTAGRCHRRLVLEYLQRNWGELTMVHL
ncbi:MAG TPA: DUF488 domain-containing protein [Steroidobacteraceae bacterium]|nr:DUF488 domain-containing protein [Steroidobacteraceae bacterium]